MVLFGYSRVSSRQGQRHDRQLDAFHQLGIEDKYIFCDSSTGATADREGLKNLMERLREDDVLVVTELARLGRSLRDLINILDELQDKRAHFKSIKEGIDTSTPTGRMTFGILASVAAFEREIILERQAAGIALAKRRGDYKGSKPKLNEKQVAELKSLRAENRFTVNQLAKMFGIGPASVYRYLKA